MSFSSSSAAPISYNPQVHHLHVVKDGETVESLAFAHNVESADILRDNQGCGFQPGELITIQLKRAALNL